MSSCGVPRISTNLMLEISLQRGDSGYSRCAIGYRAGEAKVWPSQFSRDAYPASTTMGEPTPFQPAPFSGTFSSADDSSPGSGSILCRAKWIKTADVGGSP